MTPHPLALTDDQLRAVMDGARMVPPQWRDRFLSGIADRLGPLDTVSNDAVTEALHLVLDRIGGVDEA